MSKDIGALCYMNRVEPAQVQFALFQEAKPKATADWLNNAYAASE